MPAVMKQKRGEGCLLTGGWSQTRLRMRGVPMDLRNPLESPFAKGGLGRMGIESAGTRPCRGFGGYSRITGRFRFARATHPGCAEGQSASGGCRESESVPADLRNPPESPFAEGLGVSPSIPYSSPTIGGQRGLKRKTRTALVGSASLYPPYTWIPASAGMTEEVQAQEACT